MKKNKLLEYLLKEETASFKGWDFSYLTGRWKNENLPWDYKTIVLSFLKPKMKLLDMGTGGGEFLLSLNHPFHLTSVTEGYPPNIVLCNEKLKPKGIKVYPVGEDDLLSALETESFDIVINRHESYSIDEVKRVLKPHGIFITQQVGAYNNKDLATYFDSNHVDSFPNATLEFAYNEMKQAGFEILQAKEFYPKIEFYDLGAIAYFAKIIPWEFKNFSVKDVLPQFEELEEKLKSNGYIESTEHRYYLVGKKKGKFL